ncbi:MAG TPA: phosphate/phosphite/phosphonate ABC transporter substrate-binding protein [Candidatus Competibacteraceae bacterium]|nr:phosphate/phosphite/phosphonate ABC transporter substrate-binding protein [Candidatus Competibacteraceae bacterium]
MTPPMASYNFTVSPDFNPDRLSGWYIFNTWLQRQLQDTLHLELFQDFPSLHRALEAGSIDLLYANPYDAASLVRERGFTPLARARGKQDEGVIVVRREHPAQRVEELQPGLRIATTDHPDINMICMRMLEPAELHAGNVERLLRDNYLMVAKSLLRGEAEVGFILQEAYDEFSKVLHSQLRPLVASRIRDIHHTLLAGPRLAHRRADLQSVLLNMRDDPKGPGVLESLGFQGWEPVAQEDMEFMIDLLATLED